MTRQFTADEGAAAERLDVFLAEAISATRSHAQRLIRAGHVQVNGQVERSGYILRAKDQISVVQPDAPTENLPAPELAVVYEDSDILVVEKPAGLAIHHGAGTSAEATIADYARLHSTDPDPDRPGIVHRLDRDTSGLLILAKTAEAKAFMQRQFADRLVRKTYTLLVVGRVDPADAIIRLPTGRDLSRPLRRAVVSGGRESVTRYHTVANFDGYTLLEAKPETGRTHQIRVHLAAIGHAVAGDTTYGTPKRPLGLRRQFLHATALEFTAPSGRTVSLSSALPTDLAEVINELGGSGIIDP